MAREKVNKLAEPAPAVAEAPKAEAITVELVKLADITVDPKINCREAGTNPKAVERYAGDMKGGAVFPPIELVRDGARLLLAHGFHRVEAASLAGLAELPATIRDGGKRVALVIAACSNIQGSSRTPGDRTKAVKVLLKDPEWKGKSNREIAAKLGVSHTLVNRVKNGKAPKAKPPKVETVSTPEQDAALAAELEAGDPIDAALDAVIREHASKRLDDLWMKFERRTAKLKGRIERRAEKKAEAEYDRSNAPQAEAV